MSEHVTATVVCRCRNVAGHRPECPFYIEVAPRIPAGVLVSQVVAKPHPVDTREIHQAPLLKEITELRKKNSWLARSLALATARNADLTERLADLLEVGSL